MTEYIDRLLFPNIAYTDHKMQFAINAETEEDYALLSEAFKRLTANKGKTAIPMTNVMKHFGITEAELSKTKNPEIE
ncbi:MAG: hypothetical protein NC489_20710 [Ruminococcus flavefaciens]|nr:hypothetical protein [Ruminococcus flavefaciens]